MTETNNGSLSQEKVTYRGYVKLNEKGEIDDFNAKQVTNNEKAETAKTKKLTDGGYNLHNENEIIKYTALSVEGFHSLVPSPEQQLYIINSGLNYLQNSKANAKMAELEEDKVSPTYNGVEIDLREAINEPPQKRSLSPLEKITRQFEALGLSSDERKKMLAFLLSQSEESESEATQTEEVGAEA